MDGVRKGSKTSTSTLNRTQSDSALNLIDRKKTFENAANNFGNGDLITRVVSALGSIRQYDEDEQSVTEMGVNGFSDSQILSTERRCSGWSLNPSDGGFYASRVGSLNGANQLTWNGNNSNDNRAPQSIDNSAKQATTSSRSVNFCRSVSLNMPEDDDNNLQNIVNKEVINRMLNKANSPRSRLLSEGGKRHSIVYPEMCSHINVDRKGAKRGSVISLPRDYISATSKGRGSILSILDAPINTSKSELLEKTSIADLIRALEIVHSTTSQKEDGLVYTSLKRKNHLSQIINSRRGSLRPMPGYTTIFTSSNGVDPTRKISSQSTPDPSMLSRDLSLRLPYQHTAVAIAKPTANRFSVRSSSIRSSNTSSERTNLSKPQSILLQKKFPPGPSPLARNSNDLQENGGAKNSGLTKSDKSS